MMGDDRESYTIPENDKELAALHEANHVVIGELLFGGNQFGTHQFQYVKIWEERGEWVGATYRKVTGWIEPSQVGGLAMAQAIESVSGDNESTQQTLKTDFDSAGVADDIVRARHYLMNEFGKPPIKDVEVAVIVACDVAGLLLMFEQVQAASGAVATALLSKLELNAEEVAVILAQHDLATLKRVAVALTNGAVAEVTK